MSDDYTKRYKGARALAEMCLTFLEATDYQQFVNDINEVLESKNVPTVPGTDVIMVKRQLLKDRMIFKAAINYTNIFKTELLADDFDEIPADEYPHQDDPSYN